MLITGKPEEVIVAQTLVWDNVALHASEEGFDSRVMWSPRKSFQRQLEGTYDNLSITGKVTIPTAAIGLIIGRSGATIRSFAERSGASVELAEKGNTDQTDERVLVIAGTATQFISQSSFVILCSSSTFSSMLLLHLFSFFFLYLYKRY